MTRPKMDKMAILLKKGEEFTINSLEYKRLTGAEIPKNKYYTENNSAVARKAMDYGYKITVIPEQLVFSKI